MDVTFLLRGLVIGFSIAAPVGPIGALCMRRTLTEGRAFGLVSGLGAASADAIYGCIAGFGLTFVSAFLVGHQLWLRLLGGAFLCYLGVKTLLTKPTEEGATAKGKTLIGAYGSTFLLTLTNPMTILSFAAVFAGLGLAGSSQDYWSGDRSGRRRLLGLIPLVADAQYRCGAGAGENKSAGTALGERDLWCDHHGLRPFRSSKRSDNCHIAKALPTRVEVLAP